MVAAALDYMTVPAANNMRNCAMKQLDDMMIVMQVPRREGVTSQQQTISLYLYRLKREQDDSCRCSHRHHKQQHQKRHDCNE